MKRRLIPITLLLVLTLLLCSLTSCFAAKEKTFTVADELSITLTDAFTEKDVVGQTAMFQSLDVIVTVLLEEASLFGDDLTVKEYAELVLTANKLTDTTVTVTGERAEFTYAKTVSGKDYTYFAKCYKNDTGYWLVQFACFTDDVDQHTDDIAKWAASVTFS